MAHSTQHLQLSEEEYFQKANYLIFHSCPVLRSIFCRRWKETTDSPWSEALAEKFISGIGKDFFKNTKSIQKKCLKSGKVEEWDITLLGNLLKQINWKRDGKESISLQKKENKAIEKLVQLRNQFAHDAVWKLTEEKYREKEKVVRLQLTELGLSEDEIAGVVEKAGVLNPVSGWITAKLILDRAYEYFETGDYSRAIKVCSDALDVPNLLPESKAILWEKRAAFRVAQVESMKTGIDKTVNLDEAYMDIEKALEHHNVSSCHHWKCHRVLGKIYRHKNKLELAIKHFNRAIALSPSQRNKLKIEIDCCKLLLGRIERAEHLDPRGLPVTFEERLQQCTNETGIRVTKELWSMMEKDAENFLPGQSHVQNGHRYLSGWDVPQDHAEAAKYYTKADKVGNAEGTFNLAQLYLYGFGVERWVELALKLLKKAGNMSPKIILTNGAQLPNVGARAAQHLLGLLYDQGIHVPQDAKVAALWYERAAANGLGSAANNLGILYSEGRGVRRDIGKAVEYWELGVRDKDMNSAASLYQYYREHMEPQKAREMFDKSINLGNDHLRMIQEEVHAELDEMEEKLNDRIVPEVLALEKERNQNENGLPFNERCLRALSGFGKEGESYARSLKGLMEILNPSTRKAEAGNYLEVDDIFQKAEERSIEAQRIVQAMYIVDSFEEIWGDGPPFNEEMSNELIDLLYSFMAIGQIVIGFHDALRGHISRYIESLFELHGDTKSELDRKLRICVVYGEQDKEKVIQILKVGHERYPNDPVYYRLLTIKYGEAGKSKQGLKVAEEGVSRFPEDVELLYYRAVHFLAVNGESDGRRGSKEGKRLYQHFINQAYSDHLKVPEAYYAMATLNMAAEEFDNMSQFYHMGLEAEKKQLSCYLPYHSDKRNLIDNMMKDMRHKKMSKVPESSQTTTSFEDSFKLAWSLKELMSFNLAEKFYKWRLPITNPWAFMRLEAIANGRGKCRGCGTENAPHTCSRCKRAKYCSRECQKKDWEILGHKRICIRFKSSRYH